MKNQNKTFAFKLAQQNESMKKEQKWEARSDVATAGCSGPWARGHHRWYGADQGMYC